MSMITAVAFLAAYGGITVAQTTGAICEQGYEWMFNSKSQSPCLVSAYLYGACIPSAPEEASIQPLTPNSGMYYSISVPAASVCFCNTVFYSTIGACAFCQGDTNLNWSTYKFNCSDGETYVGQFPGAIPPDTAIPAWAYMDVVTDNFFNVTAARILAEQHPPDSIAPDAPSSTAPFITSFSPTASATSGFPGTSTNATPEDRNPLNNAAADSGSSHKSNVGPIVGGVVGGVGGLAIIGGILFWFLRRSRARTPPSAEFQSVLQQPTPQVWGPMPPTPPSVLSPTPLVPAHPIEPVKLYNPDDPSTFPSNMRETSTPFTASQSVRTGFQSHDSGTNYSGVPEL